MIYLRRLPSTPTGTFGTLYDESTKLCLTVERPAEDIDHPCILEGIYTWVQYNSPTKGNVWLCQDPPVGRSMIEIHVAQTYDQLLGCIGVGDSMGTLNGLPAVMNSRDTFKMLKATLPDTFLMTIIDATS